MYRSGSVSRSVSHRGYVESVPWVENADFIMRNRVIGHIENVDKYVEEIGDWLVDLKLLKKTPKKGYTVETLPAKGKKKYDEFLRLCSLASSWLSGYLDEHERMCDGYARAQVRVNFAKSYCIQIDTLTNERRWIIPENGGEASLYVVDPNKVIEVQNLKVNEKVRPYL